MMEGIGRGADVYQGARRRAARPAAKLLVAQWADQNRILTTRSSPEPGLWRTDRTPFLADIMNSLSESSPCERVVFMKGSQIGATECGNNWIGYVIHLAPGPMMVVQPTEMMAKRNSKQRIGPLILDSPVLSKLVRPSRARDSGNTILAKEFTGGILVMVGANSAKQLRSMAAKYLFLDEVDAYPDNVDREGEPCDLAIARTTNFRRKKIFITSTPTIEGRSRIAQFFSSSDQCYYFVPCPRCDRMIVLLPEQLRWSTTQRHQAAYLCQECGEEIFDHEKNQMLPRGEWRPTAPGDGGITRGYHLSSYYSPVGWLSWNQILRQRDKATGSAEKLQTFYNTVLGLTWMDQGEAPDADRLFERRETYVIGEVPDGGLVLTAGADIQMNRIEVEIVAWGPRKISWSVDYRVLEGNTNQPEVWAKLAELMDEDIPTASGASLRIAKLAVDTGFNTSVVYDWCRKMLPQRVMAIKGMHVAALIGSPSMIEVGPTGRLIKGGLRLWPVNTAIAKEELYRYLRLSMPDLGVGENWPTGFCHFPGYSKEYFEQLTAEQLMTRKVAGRTTTRWEKIRDRNEALDCRVYARAAAASLRLETWTEDQWEQQQQAIRKSVERSALKPERRELSPMPPFRPIGSAPDSFLE
jgi:phage terminase large subunit GpA-like protein